ncbi:MAG TPA: sulfotransferase, partial [Acidimicrobiia bacterium]|nr:sulfotransferase [Acidimicrobiia bacterium]
MTAAPVPRSTIRIEDLAEPVLTDTQRAAVDYAETRAVDLDRSRLLDAARRRTGLSDFGAEDFVVRLDAMIAAVEADAGLNALGRMIVHDRFLQLSSQRLALNDLLRRHPEILEIELEAPIIVVGLPRSGTTHLVNLIAADTRLRSLPFWESTAPVPMPGDGPGRDGLDARYVRCERGYAAQMAMVPLLAAMHHQHPQAIEEEIELQDVDFASYTLEWLARVPGWRDHYLALDQRPHYEYLRRMLQTLTWLRGPRRWVLKSPQHLEQLGPLAEAFPDATFVVTHRDPVSVIQSTVTMLAYGDRVRRDSIEPETLADYWADRV